MEMPALHTQLLHCLGRHSNLSHRHTPEFLQQSLPSPVTTAMIAATPF